MYVSWSVRTIRFFWDGVCLLATGQMCGRGYLVLSRVRFEAKAQDVRLEEGAVMFPGAEAECDTSKGFLFLFSWSCGERERLLFIYVLLSLSPLLSSRTKHGRESNAAPPSVLSGWGRQMFVSFAR